MKITNIFPLAPLVLAFGAQAHGMETLFQPASSLPGDLVGIEVALEGNTAIIAGKSSAYIYTRSGSIWSLMQEIVSVSNDALIDTLALSRNTLLLGSYGFVRVFERSASAWVETEAIQPPSGQSPSFGNAVALSGDRAVIADESASSQGSGSGAAYVYTRSSAGWSLEAELIGSDVGSGFGLGVGGFGSNVAIDRDTAVVEASNQDQTLATNTVAYVFERQGTSWIETARLMPPDGSFGLAGSLAIEDDALLLGRHAINGGTAWLYERGPQGWALSQRLKADDGYPGQHFAGSVAIDSGRIAIGASSNDERGQAGVDVGAVYLFERVGNRWQQTSKLTSTLTSGPAGMGFDLAISRATILAGAPILGPGDGTGAGLILTAP